MERGLLSRREPPGRRERAEYVSSAVRAVTAHRAPVFCVEGIVAASLARDVWKGDVLFASGFGKLTAGSLDPVGPCQTQ